MFTLFSILSCYCELGICLTHLLHGLHRRSDPFWFSVKEARKQLYNMRNSFYRAKLVNVRDSALMCFTAPVGPADRPRFFSLYWIPQICKHNWSESFNTREGTWPSLWLLQIVHTKIQGWVLLSVVCLWLDQLSLTAEVKFSLFHFLLFAIGQEGKYFCLQFLVLHATNHQYGGSSTLQYEAVFVE